MKYGRVSKHMPTNFTMFVWSNLLSANIHQNTCIKTELNDDDDDDDELNKPVHKRDFETCYWRCEKQQVVVKLQLLRFGPLVK